MVLVAGADMPTLAPVVLIALTRALDATGSGWAAAALIQRGVLRPLPAALRNGAATQAAAALIADGERSLTALFRRLATRALAEGEWRGLDPAAATLRDIDRVEDLPDGGSR